MPVRLACVRPAASVHSEPGSNSQVESTEVLSLTSNLRTSAITHKVIDFFRFVLWLSKQQKPQNSEASQVIGHLPLGKIPIGQICYVLDADAPKPSTYPFNSINVKEPSTRQKIQEALNASASFKLLSPDFPNFYNRLRFDPVRHRHLRFGKVLVLRTGTQTRKPKMRVTDYFVRSPRKRAFLSTLEGRAFCGLIWVRIPEHPARVGPDQAAVAILGKLKGSRPVISALSARCGNSVRTWRSQAKGPTPQAGQVSMRL